MSKCHTITKSSQKIKLLKCNSHAFTLIELLVSISIIALLLSISIPVFSKVRNKARTYLNISNQRSIGTSITMYGGDNRDLCPESIATVGYGSNWNWSEPTKLIGNNLNGPTRHRAISEYLDNYIPDADTMYCANSPKPPYPYLDDAWQAGDSWDNPETLLEIDPLGGTFCYYWNYTGYRVDRGRPFYGPRNLSGNRRFSKLLASDYMGYDHWRSPGAFGSCEKFKSAALVPETWLLSAYWASNETNQADIIPEISLNAVYINGCVKTFSSRDTFKMKVSLSQDGTVPYLDGLGPGTYFLPNEY